MFFDKMRNKKTHQSNDVYNSVYDLGIRTRYKLPKPVYYVESPDDRTVMLVIKVTVIETLSDGILISWWDPTHERCMIAA